MKSSESRHLSRVADLGCIVCWLAGVKDTPAEIHHVREGQGMAMRASHFLTIPLCPDHHRGKHGIHGDRQAIKAFKTDELGLLALTYERLGE